MDELDLLKKDWKARNADFDNVSYNEIYKMLHKKSSSIVKWIFFISIAEFIFWGILNLFMPDSIYEIYDKFGLNTLLYTSFIINYLVIFFFIYLFYKNYKSICVADDTSTLMKKILNTRKTVNYYVYYNIIVYVILSILFNIVMFSKPDILIEILNPNHLDIKDEVLLRTMLIAQGVTLILVCGLLWLYYRVIYGILLKRLKRNYKELDNLND